MPSWSQDSKAGPPLINARADTVATKPSFRSAFKSRCCLIPADGFFEWQKTGEKTREPFYIRLAKDHPFAFAGLWEHWEGPDSSVVESCVIVTTEANDVLKPIHDRMPVILHRRGLRSVARSEVRRSEQAGRAAEALPV